MLNLHLEVLDSDRLVTLIAESIVLFCSLSTNTCTAAVTKQLFSLLQSHKNTFNYCFVFPFLISYIIYFSQGGFSTFYDDPNNDQEVKVDPDTQNKLNTIIKDQENDPQFPAYNSDAETNSISSSTRLESPSNMRHNWSNGNLNLNNNDFENGDSQSNLMKHKSWSNAVLDLRHLDEIDAGDQGVMSQQNDAYDTDSNASTPGKCKIFCTVFHKSKHHKTPFMMHPKPNKL